MAGLPNPRQGAYYTEAKLEEIVTRSDSELEFSSDDEQKLLRRL